MVQLAKHTLTSSLIGVQLAKHTLTSSWKVAVKIFFGDYHWEDASQEIMGE